MHGQAQIKIKMNVGLQWSTDLPPSREQRSYINLTVKSTSQKMKRKLRVGSEYELVQRMEERTQINTIKSMNTKW